MGNTLCVRLHMQVHADEDESRGPGLTHGVRMLDLCSKGVTTVLYIFVAVSSLEDALLVKEANPIMTQILARFIRSLRPQTRNLRCAHVARLLCMLSIEC